MFLVDVYQRAPHVFSQKGGSGSVGEIREVLMALDASLILASAGQAPREVRNTLGIFYIVNMMLIYG